MDSCFPASDKNKLHFQAGEGQICAFFHLTFKCLCFATLTEIQHLLPQPCSSHLPGLGLPLTCMGNGALWYLGASFPLSIHVEG